MEKHFEIWLFVLLTCLSCIVLAGIPGNPQSGRHKKGSHHHTAAPQVPGPLTHGEGFTIATINFEGQGVEIDFGQLGSRSKATRTNSKAKEDCMQCGGMSPEGCSRVCGNRGYAYFYCDTCRCDCHNG